MMAPVAVFGLILTGLLFIFNDRILPEANHKAKVLMWILTRKSPHLLSKEGNFPHKSKGTQYCRDVDSVRDC